jgi:hypothetical protein
MLRDERRESWILVLPTQRFIEQPRPESPARLGLDVDGSSSSADLGPIEQCWIGALILFWFASLFWVLWHLLACD